MGDKVECIYFVQSGRPSYILPQYNNVEFVKMHRGDAFGVIDIIGSASCDNISTHSHRHDDHHSHDGGHDHDYTKADAWYG